MENQQEIERLRFALEAAGIGTWQLEPLTETVTWDIRSRELFGFAPDEITTYKNVLQYMHPDDAAAVHQAVQQALDPKQNKDYEVRYRIIDKKGGAPRWILSKGKAYFKNEIAYLFAGTTQDITALVEEREKTTTSERLAALALENTNSGFYRRVLPENTFEFSPSFARIMTGNADADLLHTDFVNYILPEDLPLRKQAYEEADKTGRLDYEARVQWQNGTVHSVRLKATIEKDEKGDFRSITGTVQDVTEEATARRDAKASQELFKNVSDSSPTGLWLSDQDGMLTFLNKTLVDWTGMPYLSLLGNGWANAIIDEDRDKSAAVFLEAVNSRSHYDTQFRLRKANGEIHWCRAAGDPYFDEYGNYAGYAGFCMDIHELISATRELSESEQRFRNLIEQAPMATCLFVGKEMKVELANPIMLGYWGATQVAVGKPLAEAVPEFDGQPFMQILDEIYVTGVPHVGVATPIDVEVNGKISTYYFDFTYKPLRDIKGNIYGILNMSIDVTREVEARKKLEESELFSRTIIQNSPVAKLVFEGENMVIRTINENMLLMLGRDESIIGMPFMEAVPELRSTSLLARLQDVLNTGETYVQPEEKIELIKFGQPVSSFYNYIYKALTDTTGNRYGVMVTATDVTAQVQARLSIEEAETNLRGAIEMAELGTWSIDLNTRILDYSPRMREWFGMGQDEIITVERAYLSIRKDFHDDVRNSILHAIEPGSDGIYDVEYSLDPDYASRERIVHAQGKTFYNELGVPYKISGTAQDVTTQRMLQQALEQEVQIATEQLQAVNEELQVTNEELLESNDRLTKSNEGLEQYAYVASHDLQEPLRKIMIFSSILENTEGLTDEHTTYIGKIARSGQRMSLLIRDLLNFSRLLRSDIIMQQTALSPIVAAVIDDFELVIAEKNAVIKVDKLPVVDCVSLQINQVFYNLIGNALKFTRPGVPPEILITANILSKEDVTRYIKKPFMGIDYYDIVINDNGIGFDEAYGEQIFEVFKRLHQKDDYQGSGIGLAICRRIIENHSGYIYATSVRDSGSTFHLIIPQSH